ncbi:MAG: hypothetical protein R6V84_05775, partial [Desulfobacterales bacterium]
GSASSLAAEVELDNDPGATLVGIRADGTAAVVADTQYIYGVLLDGPTPEVVNRLSWSGAEAARPVGIDRTASEFGDIFAIADASRRIVQIVGFDGRTLKPVGAEIPLGDTAPAGLGFGRLADLYVAVGTGLVHINPYHDTPAATPIAVSASAEIVAIAVQR